MPTLSLDFIRQLPPWIDSIRYNLETNMFIAEARGGLHRIEWKPDTDAVLNEIPAWKSALCILGDNIFCAEFNPDEPIRLMRLLGNLIKGDNTFTHEDLIRYARWKELRGEDAGDFIREATRSSS
jgi:hypothetical protein